MIIYEKPGYIRVSYNPDRNFIVFDWENFTVSLREIQEIFAKALTVTQQKGCYYYVAETSKVRTVLPDDVIKWWGEVWVPKLVAARLKAIVTVVPTSALASSSTRTWQAEVVQGITMKNVASWLDALVAVKALQKLKPV